MTDLDMDHRLGTTYHWCRHYTCVYYIRFQVDGHYNVMFYCHLSKRKCFVYVCRSLHERYGAVGEQHQPDIAEQSGREGCGWVRSGRRVRAVPGVAPVRVFSVAATPARHVARRGRGRSISCGRSRVVVRRTADAPRTVRRVQQEHATATDDQRPSTLWRHVV